MADKEHVAILTQGVVKWNEWRMVHATIRPDLRGADLVEMDLSDANLNGADLVDVDLSDASLSRADLSRANLSHARLRRANLYQATLNGASLGGANLYRADLSNIRLRWADLSDANLSRVDLSRADLSDANLSRAKVFLTMFGAVDLSQVKGLETINHEGPSTIGIDTIYLSKGKIPEVFLRGCGVPDEFITFMRSLVASGQPIQFYSCFISYSDKNRDITRRIYADLQSAGVRCWFAPHDLPPGEVIVRGLDEAIRLHEKLLLILSREAIESGWVEFEVTQAETPEVREKKTILFPIRIDDAVFETDTGWARRLCTRNIGDFRMWKDHDAYQEAFNLLLHHLKQPSERAS